MSRLVAYNVLGAGAVFALRFPGLFVNVKIANFGRPTEKCGRALIAARSGCGFNVARLFGAQNKNGLPTGMIMEPVSADAKETD
jgi:hypothetical protein